nr:DUF2341 domain-containing protein [Candidatus Sigynarchaeota archaeon]
MELNDRHSLAASDIGGTNSTEFNLDEEISYGNGTLPEMESYGESSSEEMPAASNPASYEYPATWSFANDTTGYDPAGWNVYDDPETDIQVIANFKDDLNWTHASVLLINDTDSYVDSARNNFTSNQPYGTIEFYCAFGENNKRHVIRVINTNNASAIEFAFSSDGHIRAKNGSTWKDARYGPLDYEANKFVHIHLEFECTGTQYNDLRSTNPLDPHDYNLWVNTKLAFADFDMSASAGNMSAIEFSNNESGAVAYYDAIDYSWDSGHYNVTVDGANMLIGTVENFEGFTENANVTTSSAWSAEAGNDWDGTTIVHDVVTQDDSKALHIKDDSTSKSINITRVLGANLSTGNTIHLDIKPLTSTTSGSALYIDIREGAANRVWLRVDQVNGTISSSNGNTFVDSGKNVTLGSWQSLEIELTSSTTHKIRVASSLWSAILTNNGTFYCHASQINFQSMDGSKIETYIDKICANYHMFGGLAIHDITVMYDGNLTVTGEETYLLVTGYVQVAAGCAVSVTNGSTLDCRDGLNWRYINTSPDYLVRDISCEGNSTTESVLTVDNATLCSDGIMATCTQVEFIDAVVHTGVFYYPGNIATDAGEDLIITSSTITCDNVFHPIQMKGDAIKINGTEQSPTVINTSCISLGSGQYNNDSINAKCAEVTFEYVTTTALLLVDYNYNVTIDHSSIPVLCMQERDGDTQSEFIDSINVSDSHIGIYSPSIGKGDNNSLGLIVQPCNGSWQFPDETDPFHHYEILKNEPGNDRAVPMEWDNVTKKWEGDYYLYKANTDNNTIVDHIIPSAFAYGPHTQAEFNIVRDCSTKDTMLLGIGHCNITNTTLSLISSEDTWYPFSVVNCEFYNIKDMDWDGTSFDPAGLGPLGSANIHEFSLAHDFNMQFVNCWFPPEFTAFSGSYGVPYSSYMDSSLKYSFLFIDTNFVPSAETIDFCWCLNPCFNCMTMTTTTGPPASLDEFKFRKAHYSGYDVANGEFPGSGPVACEVVVPDTTGFTPFNVKVRYQPNYSIAESFAVNAAETNFTITKFTSCKTFNITFETSGGTKYTLDRIFDINFRDDFELYASSWRYARNITISTNTTVANETIRVDLDSSFDYESCRSNGEDLRFVDASNTSLSYWIEQWNDGGASIIWVRVPVNNTDTITMYYGNFIAPAGTNGDTTFTLFDDFTEGMVDQDKWTIQDDVYSTISIADGILTLNSAPPSTCTLYSSYGFTDITITSGQASGTTVSNAALVGLPNTILTRNSTNASSTINDHLETWNTWDIQWVSSSLVMYFKDGVSIVNHTTNIPTGSHPLKLLARNVYYGSGTHWKSMLVSANTTLGYAGMAVRCRSWHHYRASSSSGTDAGVLDCDWIFVRNCGSDEMESNVENRFHVVDSPLDSIQYGWMYMRNLTFNSTTVANCTLRVDLGASFDYSSCRVDGNDIRFKDVDGEDLPYWIEKWNDDGESTAWVKIPQAGTSSIVMCYGNYFASSAADGDAVFPFFDDFSGTTIDGDKWSNQTDQYSTITIASGIATLRSATPSTCTLYSSYGFTDTTITSGQTSGTTVNNAVIVGLTNTVLTKKYPTDTTTSDNHLETWNTWDIQWVSSSLVRYFKDGASIVNDTANVPTGNYSLKLFVRDVYYGPGTHWKSMLVSANTTLGQPGMEIRCRSWHHYRASSSVGVDAAVLKCDWIFALPYNKTEVTSTIGTRQELSRWNWTISNDTSCSATIDCDGGNNTLLLEDLSSSGSALASWQIPGTCPDAGTIAFAIKANDTSYATFINLANGSWTDGDRGIATGIKIDDGSIFCKNGTTWVNIANMTADQWYDIEIHYNLSSGRWHLEVNGTAFQAGNELYFESNITSITYVEIMTSDADDVYRSYVDNMMIDTGS